MNSAQTRSSPTFRQKQTPSSNSVRFGFNITSHTGTLLAYLDSGFQDFVPKSRDSERYVFKCKIPRFPLIEGHYAVSTFVRCKNEISDQIVNAIRLKCSERAILPFGKAGKTGAIYD